MSIEHTGPKAYDYQYLATATAIVTGLAEFENLEFIYPEKPGGEDAELVLKHKGSVKKYEIQVKSQLGDFDVPELTNVLCHFPAHQSSNNLLQRLIDEPETFLIVITAGRCINTVEYAGKPGHFENSKEVDIQQLKTLLPHIAAFNAQQTTILKKRRSKYCKGQSQNLSQPGIHADFLNKIKIWENLSANDMITHCRQILFQKLGVPTLQTEKLLTELLKLIKTGRDEHSNIAGHVKVLLEHFQQKHPSFNYPYVERSDDHSLVSTLELTGTSLLCGQSLCGKSTTAKAIAKHFTLQNYELLATKSVEYAERFLLDTNVVDRICILDDPMGHFYNALNSEDIWLRIKHLIQDLPVGKKLIVTANNDLLARLQLTREKEWVDLTTADKSFLKKLLTDIARIRGLPIDAVNAISTYLDQSDPNRLMQAGQLDYLINNWIAEYLKPGTDLYAIAATDADRIAATIRQRGVNCVRLFRLLGMVSDVGTSVGDDTLSYLLANDESYPAIFFERRIITVSFSDLLQGNNVPDNAAYPSYDPLPELTEAIQTELDFIFQCGFIEYNAKTGYQFRHPLYYEAAKSLLQNIEVTKTADLLQLVKRACACLSVQNALISTKQLQYLLTANNNNTQLSISVANIAFFATESIFPAVQDAALIFLSSNFQLLTEEQANDIQNLLMYYNGGSSSICWHDGQPYRPKDHIFQQSPDLLFKTLTDDDFAESTLRFQDVAKPLPPPEEAWWYALHILEKSKMAPLIVDELILNRLLNYEEAFIRSIAAYHIFNQFSTPPSVLAERVFNDLHPFVIFQGIKGFVRGWPLYSQLIRNELKPIVLTKLAVQPILVAATNFLTQFGIGYTSYSFDWKYEIPDEHKQAMWSVWPDFMSVFFEKAPENLRFNADRFLSTVEAAREILGLSNMPQLLMNWIRWMKRSQVYMVYDPTLFSLARYYIELIDQISESQRLLFANEFFFGGSLSFTAECLRYYLSYWPHLFPTEQAIILELLRDRDEQNILKAVALTGKARPDLIQKEITGHADWDQLALHERIEKLPNELLSKCLAVNFLSYRFMDLSNRDRAFWLEILGYFIHRPNNNCCLLALKILLDDLAHKIHGIDNSWGDPKMLITNLLGKPEINDYFFYLLLEDLTETTCSNTQKEWELLLEKTDERFLSFAKKETISVIERIEMHDNFKVVYKLFGDDLFNDMPADGLIKIMLKTFNKLNYSDTELLKTIEKSFDDIADNLSVKIRLGSTYDRMIDFLKKNDPTNEKLLKRIQIRRHDYFDCILAQPIAEIREKVWAPFEFMNFDKLLWAL